MAPKKGVRGRVAARASPDDGTDGPGASSSASSVLASHLSGGIRHRIAKRESLQTATAEAAPRGLAQRVVARARADEPTEAPPRPLSKNLRKDWAAGSKSAKQALQDATDAAGQGAKHLGKLNRQMETVNSKNAHRDIVRALGYPEGAPELTWLDLAGDDDAPMPFPVVCPVRLWEKLSESDKPRFMETIVGGGNSLPSMWHGLKGEPMYERITEVVNPAKTAGLGIHGDAAPTHKCDGLFTIAWNSITGVGPTKRTKYVYVVMKNRCSKTVLWKIFSIIWLGR